METWLTLARHCSTRPVNRVDPIGHAWWHWAIAAAGFDVASGMALGTMAMVAVSNSSSIQDFCDQGNWGTVAGTVGSGALGVVSNKGSSSKKSVANPNGKKGGVAHQAETS